MLLVAIALASGLQGRRLYLERAHRLKMATGHGTAESQCRRFARECREQARILSQRRADYPDRWRRLVASYLAHEKRYVTVAEAHSLRRRGWEWAASRPWMPAPNFERLEDFWAEEPLPESEIETMMPRP